MNEELGHFCTGHLLQTEHESKGSVYRTACSTRQDSNFTASRADLRLYANRYSELEANLCFYLKVLNLSTVENLLFTQYSLGATRLYSIQVYPSSQLTNTHSGDDFQAGFSSFQIEPSTGANSSSPLGTAASSLSE